MLIRTLSCALLLTTSAVSAGIALDTPDEELLKENDQKKLGKAVAAYWEALDEKKGIQEAFAKLDENIEKSQKRLKNVDLLASVPDWQQVFRLATLETTDSRAKKGKVEESEFGKDEVPYFYCLPKKYSTRGEVYPMVVIVHDQNSTAEQHLEDVWNDPTLRDSAILLGVHMDLAPEEWAGREGIFRVMFTLGAGLKDLAVDVDHVYLAGTGQGFAAAAATATAFPQRFAGLIGMGDVPAVEVANFRNLPTLLLGEGEGCKAIVAALGEQGFENCTEKAGGTVADAWAWMQENGRDAYPTHVTFSPRFPFAKASNWLMVDGINVEENPVIDAVADREANTITIDSDKVSIVELRFNDVLVDLEKPVKIIVNGTPYEEVVTRNKRMMVELAYAEGDWGRVFTGSTRLEVPEKQ